MAEAPLGETSFLPRVTGMLGEAQRTKLVKFRVVPAFEEASTLFQNTGNLILSRQIFQTQRSLCLCF